jgi:ribosomal protein S18
MCRLLSRSISRVVALSVVALVIGCAKAPNDKVAATKAVVDSAKMEKADINAATLFAQAQDSLNAAVTEINKIGPSSFTGAYAKAESLLSTAQRLASESRVAATANKAQMKSEADTLIANATSAADSAAIKMKAATAKSKKANPALDSLSASIDSLKAAVQKASAAYNEEDYSLAKINAQAVIAQADSLVKLIPATSPAV